MARALSDSASALDRAIEIAGSQSALARTLRISQNAVSRWARRLTALPPEHVLAIEAATGVSKHDLRPDIYPRDPAPAPVSAPDGRFEHVR